MAEALPAAVSSADAAFWWVALGSGAAVVLVVVVLLTMLHRLLTDLERDVALLCEHIGRGGDRGEERAELERAVDEVNAIRRELAGHREALTPR